MTESMWWSSAQAVRRAFDVTLYPLRQLITPFHDSSENFYGDVGQVKVAVRQDSTLAECVRLRQLARQVTTLSYFLNTIQYNKSTCISHSGRLFSRI